MRCMIIIKCDAVQVVFANFDINVQRCFTILLKAPLRPFKVYGHAIIVDDMIVGGLELFSSLEMVVRLFL